MGARERVILVFAFLESAEEMLKKNEGRYCCMDCLFRAAYKKLEGDLSRPE